MQISVEGVIGEGWSRPWNETEGVWHINAKETWAALEGLRRVIRPHCRIILAVDNVTAVARLRQEHIEDDPLCEEKTKVLSLLREAGCWLSVVWIPSASNPADILSRGQNGPLELEADAECCRRLQDASRTQWFEETTKRMRSGQVQGT